MFVVLGATGNTGRAAAEALLAGGHPVVAVGRNPQKLQALAYKGAKTAAGDAFDPSFLTEVFRGADGVYALLPPDVTARDFLAHYDRAADAIEKALKATGVRRVVFLSSQGAQHKDGTGPIKALHAQEERFKAMGLDLTILRPGYFYENHFGSLPLIKHQGINGGAIAPDVPFTMIATADIGAAAAAELVRPGAPGPKVVDLYGPRQYTMAQATTVIGEAIGKPDLAYVQFPDSDFKGALVQAGFSAHVADLFVEMAHAISDGRVCGVTPPTPANSGKTTLEAFAPALAQAYRAL
jgi:uncharacterized protein YbjT (DUF2867 family)